MPRLVSLLMLALFILLFLLALPVDAANKEEQCSIGPVPLEVGIGKLGQSTGLGNYVSTAYAFIVSGIAIIAAVMLAFGGLEWVASAGNQRLIGQAKERITSALIGLIIALLSYTILVAINPSFVKFAEICPPEIGLVAPGNFKTNEWATCPSKNANDCRAISYCEYEDGCACVAIGSGDEERYVCQPIGEGVIPIGEACLFDQNCRSPLKCLGGGPLSPGACSEADINKACTEDEECDKPLICVSAGRDNQGYCLPVNNRENGQLCEIGSECLSQICNGIECVAGDGTDRTACSNDEHCLTTYVCDDFACRPRVEGDSCYSQEQCNAGLGLRCVGLDADYVSNRCRDGSVGDDCDLAPGHETDCQPGLKCTWSGCTIPLE